MDGKKKYGIRDIAALAGVSTATVSYVLNQVEGKTISAETSERILAAARKLNYTPNAAARRLRTGKTGCISVRLSATLSIPRYYSLLEGIRACLSMQGYHMLLINDRPVAGMPAYLEACHSARADAVLYISSTHDDIPERELAMIRQLGIPLSTVDCMADNPQVSSAVYDYYASSSLRVEALHKQGIRRLAFLMPENNNIKFDLRSRGVMETAIACGMVLEIIPFGVGKEAVSEAMKKVEYPYDVADAVFPLFRLPPDEIEKLKALIYALPGDTGILHAFPNVQPLISDFLYKRHLLRQQDEPFPWHSLSVGYTYPHYEIGYEAARSLLDTVGGKAPRKLSFQPILIPTDPRIY